MKTKTNIIVSVEDFAKMTSSEIVKVLQKKQSYAIIGDTPGEDRHIIDRAIKINPK